MKTIRTRRWLGGFMLAVVPTIAISAMAGCAGSKLPEYQFEQAPGAIEAVPSAAVPPARTLSIKPELVSFSSKSGLHTGWLAVPLVDDGAPVLIVVPPGGKLTDAMKEETNRLARVGYVALAVELKNPGDASAGADALDGARAFARRLPVARGRAVGCLAWGGGAGPALQFASAGGLRAVVLCDPILPATTPSFEGLEGAVLIVEAGRADAERTAQVQRLRDALALTGTTHEIVGIPGADAGFSEPDNRAGYASREAEQARRRITDFLVDHMGSGFLL